MEATCQRIKKDYSQSLLEGIGENDYEKYMNTKTLLNLQREPNEMLNHSELLFQIVHQSTELWLKLNRFELEATIDYLNKEQLDCATALINRASLCIKSVTDQLEILTHLTPWDFAKIRPALGNGSGLESPGWRSVQKLGKLLSSGFDNYINKHSINLIHVYTKEVYSPVFNLCEALVNWDERVSLWRTRHYKIAVRIIGHNSIGTKGTPVDNLAKLLNNKYFPLLWSIRSELSKLGDI